MRNETILIEASQTGVRSITVRAERQHRERGLTLLQNAIQPIADLDKALRIKGAAQVTEANR